MPTGRIACVAASAAAMIPPRKNRHYQIANVRSSQLAPRRATHRKLHGPLLLQPDAEQENARGIIVAGDIGSQPFLAEFAFNLHGAAELVG